MISDWKQELVKRAGELFARGDRAPAVGDAQKVIDDLHRKIGQLQVERKLAEDDARPIIFYSRDGTCRQPYVKGLTLMVNSIFNGWRMEDVWLDK